MLGSEALEVGIGVILFFLLVSLICSAAREAIETFSKARAGDLERGLREMLADADGRSIVCLLFQHGQIASLFTGTYDPDRLSPPGRDGVRIMPRAVRGRLPSYIPSRQFADALLDIVGRGRSDPAWPYPIPVGTITAGLTVARLRDRVAGLPAGKLQRALLTAIDQGGDDLALVKTNVELWYDGTMDRVSGWYKRRTQKWLFALGFAAAAIMNLDAITVTHRLIVDKTTREAFVAQAERIGVPDGVVVRTPADAVPDARTVPAVQDGAAPATRIEQLHDELGRIGAPIGWSPRPQAGTGAAGWLVMVLGWLVTAGAVSFGAPFWFDVLNKFMVIRSTVKPREKSREEGSEDRKPSTPTIDGEPPNLHPNPHPAPAPSAAVRPIAALPPEPPEPDDDPPGFEPEQWTEGHTNPREVAL